MKEVFYALVFALTLSGVALLFNLLLTPKEAEPSIPSIAYEVITVSCSNGAKQYIQVPPLYRLSELISIVDTACSGSDYTVKYVKSVLSNGETLYR